MSMVAFADILAEIESNPGPHLPQSVARSMHREPVFAPARAEELTQADEPMRRAAAAYQDMIDDASRSLVREAPEMISVTDAFAKRFAKELALARRSREKLKMLRRRIAWTSHPDRVTGDVKEASQTMARCNAMIDAALARIDSKND